jgi:MSHA biogenesis protein MshO
MAGFTLVEMIVVIVITAVIAGGVAIFIRSPMQGYLDSVRRAALTDTADTALRRIARDLHGSLPNSVRVTGTCNGSTTCYMEFLQMRTGGRYRANLDSTGAGNPLVFNGPATVFDTMSPLSLLANDVIVNNSDRVVIYNLGIPGANAYNGDNTSVINGTGVSQITFTSKTFPLTSPGNRFQVISGPVSYACVPSAALDAAGNGTGTLTRYSGYAIAAAQPTPPAGAGMTTALLAQNVGIGGNACQFTYTANAVAQRAGLVLMQLTLTQGNESVTLSYEAHVSNVP